MGGLTSECSGHCPECLGRHENHRVSVTGNSSRFRRCLATIPTAWQPVQGSNQSRNCEQRIRSLPHKRRRESRTSAFPREERRRKAFRQPPFREDRKRSIARTSYTRAERLHPCTPTRLSYQKHGRRRKACCRTEYCYRMPRMCRPGQERRYAQKKNPAGTCRTACVGTPPQAGCL